MFEWQVINDMETNRGQLKLSSDYDAVAHEIYVPNGAPEYAPNYWNLDRWQHNCYNYALRLKRQGRTPVGSLLKKSPDWFPKDQITVANIRKKLVEDDGLEEVRIQEVFDVKNLGSHIIATVLCKGKDYHFYSLDRDGKWSHKPGDWAIEKVERKIINPSQDLTNASYPTFVGLYKVPDTGLAYYPRLER